MDIFWNHTMHIKVFSRRGWPVHKFATELWWWYEKGPTATAPCLLAGYRGEEDIAIYRI